MASRSRSAVGSGPGTTDAVRSEQGAWLRKLIAHYALEPDWIPAMAAETTAAITAELPELGAPDMRDATYASTESVVRLLVDMVRGENDPTDAKPPPAALDYAREFVHRGVPVETLLRSYHVGHATFYRRLAETLNVTVDDPKDLAFAMELSARWTFDFVEALVRELLHLYADERERWVRSAAAIRAETVEALLARDHVDVEAAGRRLRYTLDRHHVAFVVWCDEPGDAAGEVMVALERAAAELAGALGATSPLVVPLGRLVVAAWIGTREPFDERLLDGHRFTTQGDAPALAAFGTPGAGVDGFARSHREAMHARRVGQLFGHRPRTITRYRNVALAALASADLDHTRDFVAAELGPLAADDDNTRRLAATLRVYLEEHASPRRAAQRLGVHENTIANRIRTVQELLGRPIDTRVPELLVALRLAPALHATRTDQRNPPRGR